MTMTLDMPQSAAQDSVLASAEEAILAIKRGELVVVVDDEDRENEGDLIVAADHATPAAINFMITRGRGLVCAAIQRGRAEELKLPYMVARNEDHLGTAFTVSVDGAPEFGVTTGISASDRATTIQLMLEGSAGDLRRPGHVFPLVARDGGVLERPGHTEAAVELAQLAGCRPAGVIVEIIGDDGEMLRLRDLVGFAKRHGLVLTSIEKLQEHVSQLALAR
jgi:3,4-dihydroxy-2-butanone 4-phosphate synthase